MALHSTLIDQLAGSLADAHDVDASGVTLDLKTLGSVISALKHRDETIMQLDTRARALKTKLIGIMDNDTATVPSKMQLIRRALGMDEPR